MITINNKMKYKLIVLSDWATPKEKTWSGTTWSLTQALSKYYDVEIKDLRIPSWMHKLDRYARVPVIGTLLGALYDKLLKKRANRIVGENKNVPVFEICIDVKVDNPYFTYQDMTYAGGLFVKDLQRQYPFIWEAAGNSIYSKKEINRRIGRQVDEYQNANAALWMGKWICEYMKHKFPEVADKMQHIGGGTNMDISKIDTSRKTGNKFLFIGRDFNRKAGDLVVEAFKIIKTKYMPNAELHVAGPKTQPFQDIDGVYFYGDVDFAKAGELMNMCDVFCMPSRFEAYGLVFIESLIYGLPCVARKFFEMPYFIREGKEGTLVVDDKPEEYAKAMVDTINNKQMIAAIQANREFYIKEYSWDSVAQRAKAVIDQAMNY